MTTGWLVVPAVCLCSVVYWLQGSAPKVAPLQRAGIPAAAADLSLGPCPHLTLPLGLRLYNVALWFSVVYTNTHGCTHVDEHVDSQIHADSCCSVGCHCCEAESDSTNTVKILNMIHLCFIVCTIPVLQCLVLKCKTGLRVVKSDNWVHAHFSANYWLAAICLIWNQNILTSKFVTCLYQLRYTLEIFSSNLRNSAICCWVVKTLLKHFGNARKEALTENTTVDCLDCLLCSLSNECGAEGARHRGITTFADLYLH